MSIGNRIVAAVLRSPFHRVLSSSIDLVRYSGRRSRRQITLPTQYTRRGEDVIILVGRPEAKTWWRNFQSDAGLDILVRGHWLRMTGRALIGADEPEAVAPLLDAYLARFPKAARSLGEVDDRTSRAVVVWCRPR